MSESRRTVDRRTFVQATAAGLAASSMLGAAPALAATGKRRYAILGTGWRGTGMWGEDVLRRQRERIDMVALCDTNPKRAEAARKILGVQSPIFTSFDEMCDKAKPDLLMVTTPDNTHADYIARALDRGLDVITEKPMVVNEKQIQTILEAERRNNKKIVMAFNYRYSPKHQLVKELLMSGEIGKVTSVDFAWYLDVRHGADYFRRWHRLREVSGTLFVHKASHHFDLMNWWLGADPVEVVAHGDLKRYGKNGPFRHTHCRPCPHQKQCEFYRDITTGKDGGVLKSLYIDAESVDGYHRDGCIFRDDVDIFDTMSALVRYSNGVTMNYSLNAFMPFEGFRLAFNGERGRLEVRDYERQPFEVKEETVIELTRSFGGLKQIPAPRGEGGHGGGDDRLIDLIFANVPVPEHMKLPDSRAGALACAVGIAARKSVDEKRAIRIDELVKV